MSLFPHDDGIIVGMMATADLKDVNPDEPNLELGLPTADEFDETSIPRTVLDSVIDSVLGPESPSKSPHPEELSHQVKNIEYRVDGVEKHLTVVSDKMDELTTRPPDGSLKPVPPPAAAPEAPTLSSSITPTLSAEPESIDELAEELSKFL